MVSFVRRLNIKPWIIANGSEGGWLLPNHLTTMGFYILRVRSNLIDIKQVLQQGGEMQRLAALNTGRA